MKALFSFFLLLISVFVFTTQAQPLQKAENILANKTNSQWSFEENRGQLADENGVVLNDIKYYGKDKSVAIYLRQNKISFVFSKTDPKSKQQQFSEATGTAAALDFSPYFQKGFSGPEEVSISTSRIDLELAGANKNAQIVAEEKISYYTNYYLAHTPEEGITHVPHYKKITYKNIYNNIDLVLHVKDKGLKYDFVVHPIGKVSDIKLLWNGTKPDVLLDGGIKYAALLGEIKESKPFSFISGNGQEVKSAFKVQGNLVGFEVGSYDEKQTLVIDPMMVWGTYYGGPSGNWYLHLDRGNDITINKDNELYITGATESISGIATTSVHQTDLKGNTDAFIAKFNDNGIRLWGTYFGGEGSDLGSGITVDKSKNIYITGSALSFNGIATPGAYQETGTGALIARFNDNGLRVWATYFGNGHLYGTKGREIVADNNGDIIIVGSTAIEISAYIASPGAHQETYNDSADAFVAKFSSTGARLWSTYYGGKGIDRGYGICVDNNNNIYITGYTTSTAYIATPGSHQVSYNGRSNVIGIPLGGDVFIVKFNPDGVRQWGTYYGGTGTEFGSDITMDIYGDIIITGYTLSTSDIATTDVHQTELAGSFDAFIAKFNTDGKRLWGTYYGGYRDDYSNGISTDGSGNIFISGETRSASGIASKGAHQTLLKGRNDAFVAKFNNKGEQLWGSYYGGDEIEYSKDHASVINDNKGYVYITGKTNSISNISTTGTHQTELAGDYNVYIAKFTPVEPDAGIVEIVSPEENICEGNYEVRVSIKNFSSFIKLENCVISWSVNGVAQYDQYWQGKLDTGDTAVSFNLGSASFRAGNNIIKVWTYEPNGSDDDYNNNDTLITSLYFYPAPGAKTGENKSICIGDSTTIGSEAVAGNIYHWTSNPPGFNSSQSKLTVKPTITTTYYFKETDTTSGCSAEDSVTITVYPIPEPIIAGDAFICGLGTATFEINNSNNSSTYTWEVEGGSIASGQATNKIEIKLNRITTTGKVKVTEHNPGGCFGIAEQKFVYNYTPLVDLGPDQYICEDFGNLVKLDAGHGYITYRWFPTGDTTQWIEVRKVNDYYVVVTDKCGNEMQSEVRIASNCPVTIYIPNAFTPNNDIDNLNEIFRPLIENVTEYNFTIYNRWGERIFISKDYNLGWDGNYFGKSVPEGMYLWMIDCTVQEGAISRKLNKTGTVQLLR